MESIINLFFVLLLSFLCWKFFIKKLLAKSKSVNAIKSRFAANGISEEAYYEMTAAEIKNGNIRSGLWAKALSESLGDEKKAGAIYIKLRVQSMRDEAAAVILKNSETETASPNLKPNTPSARANKILLTCPNCETRMRVATGKHLDITCPSCRYIFRKYT